MGAGNAVRGRQHASLGTDCTNWWLQREEGVSSSMSWYYWLIQARGSEQRRSFHLHLRLGWGRAGSATRQRSHRGGGGIKQRAGMVWGEGSGVLVPLPLHPGHGTAPGSQEGAAGAPLPWSVCHQPKFIRGPARPRGHHVTGWEPPVFVVLMHKYSGTGLIREKLFGIRCSTRSGWHGPARYWKSIVTWWFKG